MSQFQRGCAQSACVLGHATNNIFHPANENVKPDAHLVNLIFPIHFDAARQIAFPLSDVLQPYRQQVQREYHLGLNHPPGCGATEHRENQHDESRDPAAHRPCVHRIKLSLNVRGDGLVKYSHGVGQRLVVLAQRAHRCHHVIAGSARGRQNRRIGFVIARTYRGELGQQVIGLLAQLRRRSQRRLHRIESRRRSIGIRFRAFE